jgi:hypothetical protein
LQTVPPRPAGTATSGRELRPARAGPGRRRDPVCHIVTNRDGEEWFDSQLANGRVFNTKKIEARKLILNHAHVNLSDQDRLSLAAFNAAEAAGLRAKDAARALQVQTAGGERQGGCCGSTH